MHFSINNTHPVTAFAYSTLVFLFLSDKWTILHSMWDFRTISSLRNVPDQYYHRIRIAMKTCCRIALLNVGGFDLREFACEKLAQTTSSFWSFACKFGRSTHPYDSRINFVDLISRNSYNSATSSTWSFPAAKYRVPLNLFLIETQQDRNTATMRGFIGAR